VGVGRASGDEDYEHNRKYMVEADPEETFGTDEQTAPAIIGVD
jgi:hypothetical protein